MRRLTTLALAAFLIAGCRSKSPRSDYFIVAFLPGTPALSQEGVAALRNAVEQARDRPPRSISISGVTAAGGGTPTLAQQRAGAISQAFLKDGVAAGALHTDISPLDEKGYGERKDSFIVQLAYGDMPQP